MKTKEKLNFILTVLISGIITFIIICNMCGFLIGFLSDSCYTQRKISQNIVTGFGFQISCPNIKTN